MKKIVSILLSFLLLLTSCEGKEEATSLDAIIDSNDLAKIRTEKVNLDKEIAALNAKVKRLNIKISDLDTNKKVTLVTTMATKPTNFVHYLELQGNVMTKQNVLVYPEMPGQLLEIFVQKGQYVAKGQTLAIIDNGGMENQLAQLEANAQLAKTTYERQKRLWEQKIGSEIQYLQTKTNYEASQSAVNQIQKTLGKYTIKAPFSGVIDNIIKEKGTVVAPGPGAEVFRIVNLSNMYVETDVPESYITSIKKGKKVAVELPILGKTINTSVNQAGNFINPVNRTFKVEINVPNTSRDIKPNLTARVKINDYTNSTAILIPQSIISENSKGQQYVFVAENIKDNIGVAKQVIIKTGKTQGDEIEVLDGLPIDVFVIIEGARRVKNGQEVRVLQ